MKRCVQCDGRKLAKVEAEDTIEVGEYAVTVTGVPATMCEGCGERYFHAEVVGRVELTAGVTLARAGVCTGALLRFLRKSLGMRAADLADLLGKAPETISRWENGRESLDSTVILALADMAADRLAGRTTTEDYLRAVQHPAPSTARRLRIPMGKAA